MEPTDAAVERGSGNVFADLGFPDVDAHIVETELFSRIGDIVRRRGRTQTEAARPFGLSPGTPWTLSILDNDARLLAAGRYLPVAVRPVPPGPVRRWIRAGPRSG